MSEYFNALTKETVEYGKKLEDYLIKTVFIGGGTPSYVEEKYIYQILKSCRECFNIDENAEISMEANPGTFSLQKLKIYKEAGINRLSIGLQAWQDGLLKVLGRTHTLEDFTENLKLAREEGFDNINADLIFGVPGQTLEEWQESLNNISNMGVEHISCYSLKIEEGTVFGKMFSSGDLIPMEDEEDREMYYKAKEILGKAGYKHYEISNFAKPGYECKHNLVYWEGMSYLGIGAGSHSYLEGERYNNVYSPEDYIHSISEGHIPIENIEFIDTNEKMSEFMLLGLRLVDGIEKKKFRDIFGIHINHIFGKQLESLKNRGLIQFNKDNIMLTSKGLDLANQVFIEFF